MAEKLEEKDWGLLLERIKDGECTPFLGAGACYGVLPLGAKLALEWAEKHSYPLKDSCKDLARVAQYLAVEYDPMFPKGEIVKKFREMGTPNFDDPDEPHSVLAELPLPVYITTNYDDFMFQALKKKNKDPGRNFCRWNTYVKDIEKPTRISVPTIAKPLVFHLHGIIEERRSIVLTEDDYLDYLISISKDPKLIPPRIQEAFTGTSLLFLGYGLADWDFRVLFRSIVSYLQKSIAMSHVSVQLIPGEVIDSDKAQQYLNNYFKELKIKVYWGTCRQFVAELKRRWQEYTNVKH